MREEQQKGMEKQKTYKTIKAKLYVWITKISNMSYVWWPLWVAILFAAVLDMVPFNYLWPWVEDIFSYNMGNLVAVIVVIWAFTIGLSTLFLQRAEGRFLGLRVVDVMSISMNAKMMLLLPIIVVAEVMVLSIAVVLNWPITLVVVAVLQIWTMIYSVSFVMYMTSYTKAIQLIKSRLIAELSQEEENLDDKLLFTKLFSRISYKDAEEREILLDIIIDVMNTGGYKNENVWRISCDIARYILNGTTRRSGKRMKFIKKWYCNSATTLETKKGILSALCENGSPIYYEICRDLLAIEHHNVQELCVWVIVYYIYVSQFRGESGRKGYIAKLMRDYPYLEQKNGRKQAVEFWKQIQGTKDGNFYELYKYILDE
ncbi:MAG: hypothetical protein ACI4S2_15405 [Lachnospiraceae bacterium]